jgi:DNA-binding CsgD family transcriptional regulator
MEQVNKNTEGYNLFFRFIEKYAPTGFKNIDRLEPLNVQIEQMMENHKQFFYIGDLIQMHFFHVSNLSKQMMGIEPGILNPYHFFEATHPDDIYRLSLGRAKLLKIAHDLFKAQNGCMILSTNFMMRKPEGNYSNILVQIYAFYCTIPYKSVFILKVHTNVDWYKMTNSWFHYYTGNDISYFRFPDEDLLKMGIPFSAREFEIIKLIESGLSSEEIAEKIFLSVHTVNTHRRNMLKKAGMNSMPELIYDLLERGLL